MIQVAQALRNAGRRVYFMTYEQLLTGATECVDRVFRHVVPSCKPPKRAPLERSNGNSSNTREPRIQRAHVPAGARVTHVHGSFVRDYASNYKEVQHHFRVHAYPSWASLVPKELASLVLSNS